MNIIDSYKSIFTDYKAQAARRGIEFNLTKEQAFKMFTANCYYCNDEPTNIKKYKRDPRQQYKYQGIDRLDPLKGYTEDNTVPCCSVCNYAKRELSESQFLQQVSKIYNFKVQRSERELVGSSEPKWESPLQGGDMI